MLPPCPRASVETWRNAPETRHSLHYNPGRRDHVARATGDQKYFPNENIPVHLLSQFVISPGELYSQATTPITAIGDLANCKIWVLPGPLAAISRNLGSGMVSTPGLEIQGDHLSRGS